MNKFSALLLASLLMFASAATATTPKPPRLELGFSLLGLHLPHFRGSADAENHWLLLPWFKYRGERFKIDNGIEATLAFSDDWIVTISGNASAPVDEDSPEREGMEKLKASLEIGPSLDYRLHRGEHSTLWLELPLRFALTFESNPQALGRIFQPRLAWTKPRRNLKDWKLRLAAGPIYTSQRYHDYYYSVDAADALPGRAAFQAGSGYSGLRADFSYGKQFGDYWFGGFIRYDNLNGSVIENSSLVSANHSWTSGIALTRIFFKRW